MCHPLATLPNNSHSPLPLNVFNDGTDHCETEN